MSKPTHSDPIVLEEPIKRGDKNTITEITLRRPKTGDLRHLKMADAIVGDVNTIIRMVPRISVPTLTEQEVVALDVADLLVCADTIAGFLQKTGAAESPAA